MALDPETRTQLLDAVRRFVNERLRSLEAQVAEQDLTAPEIIAESQRGG